mgnify:CR=1 FL=1
MKIVVNKKVQTAGKKVFVANRPMGSFSTGVKRSVTMKSYTKGSYIVKSNVIK